MTHKYLLDKDLRRINGSFIRYINPRADNYHNYEVFWYVCTIKGRISKKKMETFNKLCKAASLGNKIVYNKSELIGNMKDICFILKRRYNTLNNNDKIKLGEASKQIVTLLGLCHIKPECQGDFWD